MGTGSGADANGFSSRQKPAIRGVIFLALYTLICSILSNSKTGLQQVGTVRYKPGIRCISF